MEKRKFDLQKFRLILLSCGLILMVIGITLLIRQRVESSRITGIQTAVQAATTSSKNTTQTAAAQTPQATATYNYAGNLPGGETLKILESSEVPENDPIDLAERFNGVVNPPLQITSKPTPLNDGAKKNFWILETDANYYRQVEAQLVYQTPHLYFWVEDGIEYDQDAIKQLCQTFERHIYPTDHKYFGSEWTPGVDNDQHLVVIYAHHLGSAAGYFSGSDSLMPQVRAYSNVAEMFYLSADYTDLTSSFTYGVLAHEFQHMIHWNNDRNEASWVNEGFSELAVELNGYDIGGFDYYFAFDPDTQLNYWPDSNTGNTSPHYGASYLFSRYLLAQFGADTIKDIVKDPKNGFEGLDDVLADKIKDYDESWTDDIRPADQVFQNWVIANSLQNNNLDKGIYGYGSGAELPVFYPSDELSCDTDTGWLSRTVNQYGTDYIKIICDGNFTVSLKGDNTTALMPADPHSGSYDFWSNSGDESHMTLSHEFDFTAVSSAITMNYWAWYDIEKDYDYLYLTATTDGKTWEILNPTGCTTDNPTGANFSCGYSGKSEGWVEESVDLSAFAGKKVKLQFEYLTDSAVEGDGFLIDDISIGAIHYATDFEHDDGGWQGQGFVRIGNQIPQAYAVAVIQPDFNPIVEKWITSAGLDKVIDIRDQGGKGATTIAISGLTRFTNIPANYQIKIAKTD